MILDLVRKLSSIDSDLSLSISVSEDGVYTFKVDSSNGDMYSYSSTDSIECYSKILEYSDCLTDSDKFDSLLNTILSIPMEV